MTRDQFRELAEIWGGDIDRWPPATQGPARELAADEQCRRILGEQLQLDRLLSIAPDVSDDRAGRAGFAALQKLAHPDRNRAWLHRWLRRSSLFPAATFACSAILGLWLAAAIPYPQHQEALSVVSMVFDSSDAGLWGGAMSFKIMTRHGTRWLLLASLCVNVALATYVSVQWFHPVWTPGGAGMPLRMIERVAARLPKDDADILWRIYRSKEPEILNLQADYTRALFKTMRLTAQPELDKAALRTAVQDSRDKRSKIGDAVIETFTDMLEQISPKGRRQLVGGFLQQDR